MKKQCYKDLRLLTKVTCNFLTIVVALIPVHLAVAQGQQTALSPGLSRLSGTDSSSHIGEYRYNPPSAGSTNLEDSTYYLRFLLALPTLRLTLNQKAAEFNTAALLDRVRKEPLCKASLL
jgi:hypothetical protein